MFRYIHNILFIAALLFGLASCELDPLDVPGDIPEGYGRVAVEMRFTPMEVANLNAGSRSDGMVFDGEDGAGNDYTTAPDGNSMNPIHSLVLLVYNTDNELMRDLSVAVDLGKYKPELEDRLPDNATNGAGVQEQTYCVKSDMTLPYGNYKIFAVANVDGLSPQSAGIETIDKLRSIKLQWNSTVALKCPMFGYFTNERADTRGMNLEGESVVQVRPETTSLHSWIRRAASKLTIDFDGSNLRENVTVYIKDARVYDVADGCYLGLYSAAGTPEAGSTINGGFGITQSDYRIVYGAGSADDDNYENWPSVVRDSKLTSYKRNGKEVNFHDETAFCLPFFENMQGTGAMKYQDSDFDGNVDHPDAGDFETDADGNPVLDQNGSIKWLHDAAKDSKPNGTYVEVTGYYESRNNDYVSSGPIKFRFMLGKDVKNNYDCERNHHYKLTLSFKGNGNDADWHIEYDETPGIHLPNPLYISYLYNHSMIMPMRINTGGKKIKSINIDISSNNWAPEFSTPWDGQDPATHLDYNHTADKNGEYGKKYPYNGFLSLIRTSQTVVTEDNKAHYEKKLTDEEGFEISRGHRLYSPEPGEHGTEELGKYTILGSGNVIEMQIPLYTRAKQLVSTSAYTGNNPYVGYPRKAVLSISITLSDDTKLPVASTEVYQVRQIVNPKGVYRNYNNNTPFHVVMKQLDRENATEFTNVESQGPWRAYIVAGDSNFIKLDGQDQVEGTTRTAIDFNIQFQGTISEGEKDTKSRFAIVRVEYHNYSCVHLIFVRQGHAPVRLYSGSPAWHTFNMYTKDHEVDQVVGEGSLFRFCRWDYPIDASCNKYTHKNYWVNVGPADFSADKQRTSFTLATTKQNVSWATIGSEKCSQPPSTLYNNNFADPTVNGKVCTVATVDDFMNLKKATEQGYGVLYGDGATEVQSDLNKAYGYQRDVNGVADAKYGMRGCFAYVAKEGDPLRGYHVFFPIGASGYGHRKHSTYRGLGTEPVDGTLRYACGRTSQNTSEAMPLFYDLYMRPGAIYWAKQIGTAVNANTGKLEPSVALDINYFTFDFNYLPPTNIFQKEVWNGNDFQNSDACFIRCVDR